MIRLIIDADLSSEELQVLISEVNILHRDVFKKPLVLQQTACYTALEQLEQMLSKVHEDIGSQIIAGGVSREKTKELDAINTVIQLIKASPANAV